ncbi:hypothetical protein EYF80_015360 [Liparis tanakae]|uniref:Uncharacterized protein n=1 Tax=Liparis tanakae TaxID=230148 RepID=A0A4Z2I9I0_9TELE|nr:hypothetical protein EYF80_015360 [Liparis tanakae]
MATANVLNVPSGLMLLPEGRTMEDVGPDITTVHVNRRRYRKVGFSTAMAGSSIEEAGPRRQEAGPWRQGPGGRGQGLGGRAQEAGPRRQDRLQTLCPLAPVQTRSLQLRYDGNWVDWGSVADPEYCVEAEMRIV